MSQEPYIIVDGMEIIHGLILCLKGFVVVMLPTFIVFLILAIANLFDDKEDIDNDKI